MNDFPLTVFYLFIFSLHCSSSPHTFPLALDSMLAPGLCSLCPDLLSVLHVLSPQHVFQCLPFISTSCGQKKKPCPKTHSVPALPPNKISWLKHIIDRNIRKKKKKHFPCFPGMAAHSIVLSAFLPSWLWSASAHPSTSINATCYAASVYTHSSPHWGHTAETSEHKLHSPSYRVITAAFPDG